MLNSLIITIYNKKELGEKYAKGEVCDFMASDAN